MAKFKVEGINELVSDDDVNLLLDDGFDPNLITEVKDFLPSPARLDSAAALRKQAKGYRAEYLRDKAKQDLIDDQNRLEEETPSTSRMLLPRTYSIDNDTYSTAQKVGRLAADVGSLPGRTLNALPGTLLPRLYDAIADVLPGGDPLSAKGIGQGISDALSDTYESFTKTSSQPTAEETKESNKKNWASRFITDTAPRWLENTLIDPLTPINLVPVGGAVAKGAATLPKVGPLAAKGIGLLAESILSGAGEAGKEYIQNRTGETKEERAKRIGDAATIGTVIAGGAGLASGTLGRLSKAIPSETIKKIADKAGWLGSKTDVDNAALEIKEDLVRGMRDEINDIDIIDYPVTTKKIETREEYNPLTMTTDRNMYQVDAPYTREDLESTILGRLSKRGSPSDRAAAAKEVASRVGADLHVGPAVNPTYQYRDLAQAYPSAKASGINPDDFPENDVNIDRTKLGQMARYSLADIIERISSGSRYGPKANADKLEKKVLEEDKALISGKIKRQAETLGKVDKEAKSLTDAGKLPVARYRLSRTASAPAVGKAAVSSGNTAGRQNDRRTAIMNFYMANEKALKASGDPRAKGYNTSYIDRMLSSGNPDVAEEVFLEMSDILGKGKH